MLMLVLLVVLAGGGGGAYYYFMQPHAATGEHATADEHEGGEAKAAVAGSANYVPLQPPFVVNLSDTEASRYLQADMEVLCRDPKVVEDVKLHMPHLRDRILLLLSQQRVADLSTREGKEALQAKILAEIQAVLKKETGKPGVEAVYFTSFVMQ
jgi:flagellar FliL protein